MKHIAIIGSGFSSLSAACYLAQSGHKVSVFEKNNRLGGRAAQFKKEGFTFGLIFLPFIFYPMLAFDSSIYTEPKSEEENKDVE